MAKMPPCECGAEWEPRGGTLYLFHNADCPVMEDKWERAFLALLSPGLDAVQHFSW